MFRCSSIAILTLGAALIAYAAWAQQVSTPGIYAAVCAYNTTPPTVSTGNFVLVQCNSSGQLTAH